MEGSSCGQIKGSIPAFYWMAEKNHEHLIRDSGHPGREFNPESRESEV
jgi:hypothetical protein